MEISIQQPEETQERTALIERLRDGERERERERER